MSPDIISIEDWDPDSRGAALTADLDALSDILHAVVHSGAGVSFVVPFSTDEARTFWTGKVLPGLRAAQSACWWHGRADGSSELFRSIYRCLPTSSTGRKC